MASRIVMTALSQTMEKGRLVQWHVAMGDKVEAGTPLLSVETDKAVVDVESPIEGVVLWLIGREGEEYTIGHLLAWIGEPGERLPADKESPASDAGDGGERVTPVAARLAQRHRVDVNRIEGTGPRQRVTKQDVLRYVAESGEHDEAGDPQAQQQEFDVVAPSALRRRSGERLADSWRETPQVSESLDVDFSQLLELRIEKHAAWSEAYGKPPTINDFVIKAAVFALGSHPELNVMLVDGDVRRYRSINICVAVDTTDGLLTPVVHGAGSKSVFDISLLMRSLVQKARTGSLEPDDLVGGTFTISNLGPLGIDWFTPLLNPPQAAILGIGGVKKKVVVIGDEIAIRSIASAIVTFDHRALDGAVVARFLDDFRCRMESPAMLIE